MHLYTTECANEPRGHLVQFARVFAGKLLQDLPPLAREAQDGAAFIFLVCSSLDQIFSLRPVDQFNCAVVLQAEPICRIGDCDRCFVRRTCNLEKQLVLLRLKAGLLGRALAEQEKAT